MKKTEKKKISLKKSKDIDLEGAQKFIEQGISASSEEPYQVEEVVDVVEEKETIIYEYPWEDETQDLKKLKPIPTVSLPLEYTLKLEYIRDKIGFTKQSVCRNAIIERIDKVLSEHLKR